MSPISLKLLQTARWTLGLVAIGQKSNLPFRTLMRLGGAGYKSYPQKLLKKKRLKVVTDKTDRNDPYLMDEWWIG